MVALNQVFIWTSYAAITLLVLYVANAAARSLLVGIPSDYFIHEAPHRSALNHAVRMLLGGTLIVLGILMLALPGPGVVTIVAGVLVTDGGGKRAIVRRILRSRRIGGAIDALRRRAGQAPLVMP
jgi:hypothetical protein